ncbi:capsular polysaccharide biosynthesis protein [Ensifer adhaerens]|uniref:capsular polysaccharide export protein, LipB/KpsS family n=1 Tax=Ensifer adhaerens TaxID=106592 RepID=UPI00384B923A
MNSWHEPTSTLRTQVVERPQLFLFGFSRWKTFIRDWFPDAQVISSRPRLLPLEFDLYWKRRLLRAPGARVLAWQYNGPSELKKFCFHHRIPFQYVEDGFLRSVALGALKVPPLSLCFDSQDMYFNAKSPTDLEDILQNYDFQGDVALLNRASSARKRLLVSRLSKYNSGQSLDISSIYGDKVRRRVLVVGQVEVDASIAFGCTRLFTNNDLVRLAAAENPDSQIIYKPHPEVLTGTARARSNPAHVRDVAMVLHQDIGLADSLETVDHVYTITSLSGFEALLRGIKVTTLGCPFYSGWGLTDDRQPNARRTRKLGINEIFAAAYILYARYLDPVSKKPIQFEQALEILANMKSRAT